MTDFEYKLLQACEYLGKMDRTSERKEWRYEKESTCSRCSYF